MEISHKNLNQKELKAYTYIRNQLVHYNQAPSVRAVMAIIGSNAPRSAELVINSLISKDFLRRNKLTGRLELTKDAIALSEGVHTVSIPLIGQVSAGVPILAEENVDSYIPVDERLIRGNANDYFLLRVVGNSMNKRNIEDGDIVIVKSQPTAELGDNVVALIDNEATIKEFIPLGDKVILKPHSTDKSIQPVILHEDFMIRGIVVGRIARPGI